MLLSNKEESHTFAYNFYDISKCCMFVHGFQEAQASKAICTLVRLKLKFYTG